MKKEEEKIAVKNKLERTSQIFFLIFFKQNILGNLQREQGKGRDKIKLKKNDSNNKEKELDTK